MQDIFTIGIVGFGFSGLAALAAIVKQTKVALKVVFFESCAFLGKGIAFATADPKHLLNVRASQMGAIVENPNDFYEWLCDHEDLWRSQDPYFETLEIFPHSFLPRKLYGIYLQHFFCSIQAIAKNKNVELVHIDKKAIDACYNSSNKIDVIVDDNSDVLVDKLIIAIGVPTSKKFPFESSVLLNNSRYIPDIWKNDTYYLALCSSKEPSVVVIGTGLTMIDAVTTLHSKGYRGKIVALSTKGQLPEYHLQKPSPSISFDYAKLPRRLLALFKVVRRDIQFAISSRNDFRPYIDAIRPLEIQLWKQFSYKEKRAFFKYLFSSWNRLRHRMSYESFLLLKQLQDQKNLCILSGKIENVESCQDKLAIHYRPYGSDELKIIESDFVIKCSGPQYDITKRNSPFIHNLHSKGLIDFDELDLGLAMTPHGAIQGKASGRIYALGSLLFGELFETTAVPEIRAQAFAVAEKILA